MVTNWKTLAQDIATAVEENPHVITQTKDMTGRLPDGRLTRADNPKAVQFCLTGSVQRTEANGYASHEAARELWYQINGFLDHRYNGASIYEWFEDGKRNAHDVARLLREVATVSQ